MADDIHQGDSLSSSVTSVMRTISNDVSSSFNSATVATGALIIGGLMVLSVILYMFDTWATARIDSMLLDHYGPEMYSKMTSEFDPEGVAALSNYLESTADTAKSDRFGGHFDGWSDEDVIRAYLLNQLRKTEVSTSKYMQPMAPMFLSSSQLAGY